MSEDSDRVLTGLYSEIQNLESTPDREEAGALAADLREAVNLIVSRASAREEARRKKSEWDLIVPQCREARDRFEKLNREAETLNENMLESHRQAEQAEGRLNQARDSKPGPYATPQELANWREVCKTLEDELEAARAKCRGVNERRGEVTQALLRARNDFSALQFRERNLRPPDPVRYEGVQLSGVR